MASRVLEEVEMHTGEAKSKRPEFSAWIQASTSVSVPDVVNLLPAVYTRTIIEADKGKIKEALVAGIDVAGCALVTARSVRFR